MDFKDLISSVSPRWALIVLASALGLTAVGARAFESEESKTKRAEQKRRKELRVLADRISNYARTVHRQFPTGDVVVSERDIAQQLRKRPDAVVTALNLLLNEQKVQQTRLSGYWKLNS
jgi:predicted ABC-class ATPase